MAVTVQAISSDNITGVGVGVIVALVIVGLLLGLVISKLIARLVIALVVVALAIVVWQQRSHVQDEINTRACNLNATFFGVHIDAPDSVKAACNRSS